jgi:hypothetical protein
MAQSHDIGPRPRHPYAILAAAVLLPGSGHVLQGMAQRGLTFLFFIAVLGWASRHLMPDHASFVGRHIGGVFVYGMSILDAYRTARVNWEKWSYAQRSKVE